MADPPRKRAVKVAARNLVAPEVYVLAFDLSPGDALRFDPGQFVTFYVPKDGVTVTRSYSIASTPDEETRFELCLKRVEGGYVSTYLTDVPIGQTPNLVGPLGRFLLREPGDRQVVFVCTGTGIAPFIPMTERLLRQHPAHPTRFYFGGRHIEDILYRDRMQNLAHTHPNFSYVPVLSQPPPDWRGFKGHLEAPLEQQCPDMSRTDTYICGLPPMVAEVQELALRLGCPKDHIFVERY